MSGANPQPDPAPLTVADARALSECLATGGVAVLPTDTVYGLACDPDDAAAVRRLYQLKGRPPEQPAAVMFLALHTALDALPELGARERDALEALLPGPLTVLLPNPRRRHPLACDPRAALALTGAAPRERSGPAPDAPLALGLRVPLLPPRLVALCALGRPLLQSSANLSGGPDPHRLADVPASIRAGADLLLDGGELPGVASTVLDLRDYAHAGQWRILRAGPLDEARIAQLLG